MDVEATIILDDADLAAAFAHTNAPAQLDEIEATIGARLAELRLGPNETPVRADAITVTAHGVRDAADVLAASLRRLGAELPDEPTYGDIAAGLVRIGERLRAEGR